MKYLHHAVAVTIFIAAMGSIYVEYSQGAVTVVKDARMEFRRAQ